MVRATVCLPLLLAAAYLVSSSDPAAETRPFPIQRALWITRWDYRTEDEVCTVVGRAAAAGFDTIFFQVRGNGTVFYSSRLEPWAEELGFEHPGFDPLETACRVAGEVGIAVRSMPASKAPSGPVLATRCMKRAILPPRQRLSWLPPGPATKPCVWLARKYPNWLGGMSSASRWKKLSAAITLPLARSSAGKPVEFGAVLQ